MYSQLASKPGAKITSAGFGFKVVTLVGLLNAIFYSATISTEIFLSSMTGLQYGGEPLLIQSIEHTASLEDYLHYLLYVSSVLYPGRLALAAVCLLVQLAVTARGLVTYLHLGLSAELVAYYSWCFSASLVLLGAFALEVVSKHWGRGTWEYTLAMSALSFFGWWHVFYDILIPLGLHVNGTGSSGWEWVVKWGCFPFAAAALCASFAIGWHDNDFFQNLHLNVLINLPLFAHGCYWVLVTYRAFTGSSNGSTPAAVQRYLNYALCWHALFDMPNQYVSNPENNNANTTLFLAFLLMMMNPSFDKFMREFEKLWLAKKFPEEQDAAVLVE